MDLVRRAKEIASILSALAHLVPSGGGGGGSSDFSTATVTVTVNGEFASVRNIYIDDFEEIAGESIYSDEGVGSIAYTVPLYKSKCVWNVNDGYTVVTTGDITYNENEQAIIIAGDGTITLSEK